jgi:hypothetical protein
MIRPTIIPIAVALVLLGPASQASSGQQLGCLGSGGIAASTGWMPLRQANFNAHRQTGICRRQLVCASRISFLAIRDTARGNLCVRALAAGPSSNSLRPVQP